MDDWTQIIDWGLSIVLAGSAIYVTIKIAQWSQRAEKTAHTLAQIASMNALNSVALSSTDNLMVIDGLYKDGRESGVEAARHRWAAFMALQVCQHAFIANKAKVGSSELTKRYDAQVLDLLLQDQEIVSLVENRGFDPEFVKHCRRRLKA